MHYWCTEWIPEVHAFPVLLPLGDSRINFNNLPVSLKQQLVKNQTTSFFPLTVASINSSKSILIKVFIFGLPVSLTPANRVATKFRYPILRNTKF
jgi:hypothetical protein